MQLMPETAASLGIEDPFDIEQNIKGGVRFLKACLNQFDQNLPLALAAYNAGPGRVVEHQGMPPYQRNSDLCKENRSGILRPDPGSGSDQDGYSRLKPK